MPERIERLKEAKGGRFKNPKWKHNLIKPNELKRIKIHVEQSGYLQVKYNISEIITYLVSKSSILPIMHQNQQM